MSDFLMVGVFVRIWPRLFLHVERNKSAPPTDVGPPYRSLTPPWRGPPQGEFTTPSPNLHPLYYFPIKAALSDPFSVPPDLPRVSPTQAAAAAAPPTAAPPSPDAPSPSGPSAPASATTSEPSSSSWSSSSPSASVTTPAEQEAWRAEYEEQVVEWRRQSADVRAHAEAERARWAGRRAREREEQLARGRPDVSRAETGVSASGETASTTTSEWEAVPSVTTQQSASVLPPSTSTSTSTAPDPEPRGRSGAPAHLHLQQASRTQVRLFPFPFLSSPRSDDAFLVLHTYIAEPAAVHERKRTPDAPRAVRLAAVGKRALLADVVVPFHVVPRAFATPLARASFTCAADDDDDPRCPPGNSGIGNPCRVRPRTACKQAHLGPLLFAVHQYVLAICERGDARIWRNFCKDGHSWMARMGPCGRSKRGTWCSHTKPVTKQIEDS
jgi:hypothetical protein